jgi:hypothetical protein
MRFIQYKLANSQDASADFYSTPVDISSAVACGLHVHVASGTVKGKAYVQVSCDPVNTTPGNFVTIGSGADLTGSALEAFERLDVCANWARLYWDHSSSTGNVTSHLKTIGY